MENRECKHFGEFVENLATRSGITLRGGDRAEIQQMEALRRMLNELMNNYPLIIHQAMICPQQNEAARHMLDSLVFIRFQQKQIQDYRLRESKWMVSSTKFFRRSWRDAFFAGAGQPGFGCASIVH